MNTRMLVLLLAALGLLACQSSDEQARMVGQTESDRIELSATFAEPIISRLVKEGQVVKKGDIIIQTADPKFQSKIGTSRIISFYDHKAMNKMYCDDVCTQPLNCENSVSA
jgi:hypothetical protein